MRWLFAIAIVAVTVTAAWANLPKDWIIIGGGVSSASGGNPVTACNAGAIDLSLSTGCNIPFYLGGIFP